MSAMPERVLAYVSVFGTYSQIKDEYHDVECILVPESRLLAAEARLAEVEAELDAERRGASEIARLAEAEIATLRAERDALVPLARLGLWTLDVLAKGKDGVIWNTIDFDGGDVVLAAWDFNVLGGVPLHPEQGEWPQTSGETAATTQARAILAREGT